MRESSSVCSSNLPLQAKGALFSAEIIPTDGGATGLADMRAAYVALDEVTRARIEGLAAHHSRRYSMERAGHHIDEAVAGSIDGTPRPAERRRDD